MELETLKSLFHILFVDGIKQINLKQTVAYPLRLEFMEDTASGRALKSFTATRGREAGIPINVCFKPIAKVKWQKVFSTHIKPFVVSRSHSAASHPVIFPTN